MPKLDWLKAMWEASAEKICLVLGALLLVLSFAPISYHNQQWSFRLEPYPVSWILFVAAILLLAPVIVSLWRRRQVPQAVVQEIANGHRIELLSGHTIDIVTGGIQDARPDAAHGAVVLPANTKFDDECIRDGQSSLGAFFQAHFPNGIDDIQKMIQEEASRTGAFLEHSGDYAPGTTVFLDKPLGSGHRILVTAVTRIAPDGRISADTLSLMASIKEVLQVAAANRLTELRMPVLGTGHGGLDFSTALPLMLFQMAHCMTHEGAHQVRRVTVVVYDPGSAKTEEIGRTVQAIGGILRR